MSKGEPNTNMCLRYAADIVVAYISHHKIPPHQLPELCSAVYAAVRDLSTGDDNQTESPQPAMPISKSVTPEFLICLEDGKKLRLLKRYLRTHYDMSPEEYRRKWGLPLDYPMIAPNSSRKRSQTAIKNGFGRTPGRSRKKRKKAQK